ncbi:uncharacterized protein LOC108417142 [Pygocentrus nattereri]|uniref:uncharacterized protein LOC108417142 n=1 Tax=Pygocentrus nattereri TaxID=42514 RepID=UPI00189164F7|nr:uncharacterized protein LOC108417142 [Pygocentrus nattereri]
MKILLIFTLYLISGQVGCSDVIGYPGGIVEIYCNHHKHEVFNEYFCKVTPRECLYIDVQNPGSQRGRLSLLHYAEGFLVSYRNLSLQDAGLYQCGEAGGWSHTVNLKVNSDPCCLGSNTVSGYLGETVAISCSYPEEFKRNYKFLLKQDVEGFTEVIRTPESPETQKGRFFISEDRRSKVLSVRISDVREADGGVYFCGVWIRGKSVSYYSLYTDIQLQVSDIKRAKGPSSPSTPDKPTTTSFRTTATENTPVTSDEEHFSSSVIIIPVCVFLALLLIGGSALIYKLRCKKTREESGKTVKKDSGFFSRQSRTNENADDDYENDPPRNRNIVMSPVYQSLHHYTNQSDSVYQSLNPNTNQSDSVYQSLNPNTIQSDSVYQSLNPNINQLDSVYQSLNPNTNQSDSVYQTLNPQHQPIRFSIPESKPNTSQSDSVYQSLNHHQSDSVYQSLNPNTSQSDSVYQSLNPNTNQSDSVYQSPDPRSRDPDSDYYSLKLNTT